MKERVKDEEEEDLRIFGPSYWEEVDWPFTYVFEIEFSSHWKRGRAKEQSHMK